MNNPELGVVESAFRPLVETVIPANESDIYVQQLTKLLHKRMLLRLLELLPETERREFANGFQIEQTDLILDNLSNRFTAELLHSILHQEAEHLTTRWVGQMVKHASQQDAFRLRHKLTEME